MDAETKPTKLQIILEIDADPDATAEDLDRAVRQLQGTDLGPQWKVQKVRFRVVR